MSGRAAIFREILNLARELGSALKPIVLASLALEAILIAALFPYHTEAPERVTLKTQASDRNFYDQTYSENAKELKYIEFARASSKSVGVEDGVSEFVQHYHLENARVLDVGAGSGLLQDQVRDYTGLDISANGPLLPQTLRPG